MHTYLVVDNRSISPSTQLLTLGAQEHDRPFGFQPGQYAAISFKHRGRMTPTRCFSIVSSPTDQEYLQFATRISGHFTKALQDLAPGDRVRVFGPFGGFVFNTQHDVDTVMIAGGIGITPLMSMIRYNTRLQTKNNMVLCYSSRTASDIPFKDDLLTYERQNPHFKAVFAIGDKNIEPLHPHQAVAGSITPEVIDQITGGRYANRKFFICGPPAFMKAMVATLDKKGVKRNMVVTEAFSQASPTQTGLLKSWSANVYALSALGVLIAGTSVAVSDLVLNVSTTLHPSAVTANRTTPFLITNARQKQLDQLVNSIPISPDVVLTPTQAQSKVIQPSGTGGGNGTTTLPPINSTPPPSSSFTALSAPPPRTTVSSDRRLKTDIGFLGFRHRGLPVYRFRYKNGDPRVFVGVMAQDVLKRYPHAVSIDNRGYYRVNYAALGLTLRTITNPGASRC